MPKKGISVGISDAERVPSETRGVPLRRVQGIASNVNDIRLRGERWDAVADGALTGGVLRRKIKGATELEVELHDHNRKLLRSTLVKEAHRLELDGLQFVFQAIQPGGNGEPSTLKYEPLIVHLMKQIMGPHKAFRDRQTRAQFAKSLAMMVPKAYRPRFVSPELDVIQPIKTEKQGREAHENSLLERGKGIDEGTELTVKGIKATPSQKEAGERALRVAESLGAPPLAQVALMAALIVETLIGKIASNWLGIEPASVSGFSGNPNDLEASVTGFLKGYSSDNAGAIAYVRQHPDAKAYEVAQDVQRSGAGLASHGASNYGPWVGEGREWVEAMGGGGAETTVTSTQRYAYTQSKKESNWRAFTRLGNEVNWRAFESAGWLYFIDELDLLQSRLRLLVSDSTPGIIDTFGDFDVGKPNTEFTIEAHAKEWAAPPGAAINVTDHGPLDGIYVVEQIESGLARRGGVCTITCKRPTKPLPEPAAKKTTKTIGGAGNENASGVPEKVQQIIDYIDAASQASTTYLWGGGHGSFGGPEADKDCSGFVSAAVHAAGYLSTPLTSGSFASVFPRGEGEWVTIYGDAKHVFMKVKQADGRWRYAGTGGTPGGGAWVSDSNGTSGPSAIGSKAASHPPGL